jgi:lipase
MQSRPDLIYLDGVDGPLGALRWPAGEGAPAVLAIHGTTGNAWHFAELAHRFEGDIDLIAVDLRGRGRSFEHRGPWGLRYHAADVAKIVTQLGVPVLLVGHSLGASVALLTAEQYPGLAETMVLVDGGSPIALPDGASVDLVLDAMLGTALKRLRTIWPDRVSYQSMWADNPPVDVEMSVMLERVLLSDLIEVTGGFRAAVNERAVIEESRELLVDAEIRSLLTIRDVPTPILRAEIGTAGNPAPTITDETTWSFPQHIWQTVEETNHSSILLGPIGATAVARTIRSCLAVSR